MSCSRCLAGQATPLPQVDRNVAWHSRQHSKEVTLGIFFLWITLDFFCFYTSNGSFPIYEFVDVAFFKVVFSFTRQ